MIPIDTTNAAAVAQSVRGVTDALAAPFEPREVKWKPQLVKQNKCLAIAYVDVRLIEDRLDEVLGVECWQDEYEVMPDGSVTCKLRVRLADQWITKMDVGSPSEQPDGGDRLKAAFSDALKRTAVKYGIGRYLYRLPGQWVDYDPAKKQIVRPPQLPAFAIPAAKPDTRVPPQGGSGTAPPKGTGTALPADGAELARRLQDKDAKLAGQKLIARGALIAHVLAAGRKAGYAAELAQWAGAAIPFAVEAVKEFEKTLKAAA